MSHEEWIDALQIRELAGRFSDAVNRRDLTLFRSLWTDDAHWIIKPPMDVEVVGPDSIVSVVDQLLSGWELFVQTTHEGTVHVAGERARARFTMNELGRAKGQTKAHFNFGLYSDELVKSARGWRFRRRVYHYLYLDESPVGGKGMGPLPADLDR